MPKGGEQQNQQVTEVVFSWHQPEYDKYEKTVLWYLLSILFLVVLVAWSLLEGRWFGDRNYLFALFLILFYLVVILHDQREPDIIRFVITPDGVKYGPNFYDYEMFSNFYVIYEDEGVKRLYFDFKNPLRGRLAVSLDDQNPIAIREFLLEYLDEDLDRTAEPVSERLRRLLRL